MQGDIAPRSGRRVVVIGGGWGGATAAKYVRLHDPSIEVVLIEPNRRFVSCPFSTLVLSGVRTIDSLTFDYGRLRRHGMRVLHEAATGVEPSARRVRVGGGYLAYDRLIVAPGVEFQWEQVDLRGQPQGYLGNQMLLFKSGRRSPGDKALQEMKILMKAIPEATLADLAAYFASRQ